MSERPPATDRPTGDDHAHLEVLGYGGDFHRSMSLWSTISLGFTYLSPLVGVYSLFALSLSVGGPPAFWWMLIVACGQLMVALVFGEVVSQYPLAGGIYPWTRRLWGRRYAWIVSWVYLWAMIVTVTSVTEFGSAFVAPLLGIEATPGVTLVVSLVLLGLALAFNFSGTHMLARIARIGLAAELVGVLALGFYLLIFKRQNGFGVLLDPMGAGGSAPYWQTFLGAALCGLFLFYGFEACGDVAEEVNDPGREVPRAMILTILIGGVSAVVSFAGYVLAAPNLQDIVDGKEADPIPSILTSALGSTGERLFLIIAVTAFVSCVLSLQAAASRLLFAFARDRMMPASGWLSHMSDKHAVPTNSLLVACLVPMLLCVYIYLSPDALVRITSFAVFGIYFAFQAVVLAALRQRLRGWRPAGRFSLGSAGLVVNALALAYGLFAMFLLIKPGTEGSLLDRWIVLVGFLIVLVSGLAYLVLARPDRHSSARGEGDAIEVAERLRALRAGGAGSGGATVEGDPR